MDHDEFPAVDRLLERMRVSALSTLDAAVDVEQRLRDLHRLCDEDPDPFEDEGRFSRP